MPSVQVLLSTYNGADYLSEQLDSLLLQTHSDTRILIRDDGSIDATIEIIKQYQHQHPDKITLIEGSNQGVIKSFLSLLHSADEASDYFCFCDQDDSWMPDKIERALASLDKLEKNNPDIPCAVFTATYVSDHLLNPLSVWPAKLKKDPSFYNALIQNIAVGATLTLNRSARALVIDVPISVKTSRIIMHDWWIYMIVSYFGKVEFDPLPSIYYRQHSNNVVGGEASTYQKLIKKLKSFWKYRGKKMLQTQAVEFARVYNSSLITNEEYNLQLQSFIEPRTNFYERIKYLKKSKLYRQSFLEQYLFKLLIIVGYI